METSIENTSKTCTLREGMYNGWTEDKSKPNGLNPPLDSHLPSYLSLACTINGYCTTTNYDPVRLSKSRDASPNRLGSNLTPKNPHDNTNSTAPNVVPLPAQINGHGSDIETKDLTDGCANYFSNNCVIQSTPKVKKMIERIEMPETETKSFIQQRVERLYGPGALAQGFFVTKRRKKRISESELLQSNGEATSPSPHSKSMNDKLLNDANKSMISSPSLPVLRHLRPEFRAQLTIMSPKRSVETIMQKSNTSPTLNVNGHVKTNNNNIESGKGVPEIHVQQIPEIVSDSRDGHYFLKILDRETTRLLDLASKVENEMDGRDLPDEIVGKLRSASGKARLLVNQKMQQFKGLCTNNITQVEGQAFPTTCEDLQGFWDMVMLQVDQVDSLFKEIDELKKSGWKEVDSVPQITNVNNNINAKTKPKRLLTRKVPDEAQEELKKRRIAERKKLLEEKRKAMKAQMNGQGGIEIYVPDN